MEMIKTILQFVIMAIFVVGGFAYESAKIGFCAGKELAK